MKIYKLLGIDKQVWQNAPAGIKKAHLNLFYALILVSVLSIATGIELTTQFSESSTVIMIGGLIWGSLIFTVDYLLITGKSSKAIFVTRSIFGFSSILVGVISILLLLNNNDIKNFHKESYSFKKDSITTNYNSAKALRYASAVKKDSSLVAYHLNNCEVEANNRYAGHDYDRIHDSYCVPQKAELDLMITRLDSAEVEYKNLFDLQLLSQTEIEDQGFSGKVETLFMEIILPNPFILIMSIIMFFLLAGFEFSALFAKMNINKEDKLLQLQNKYESLAITRSEQNLVNQSKLEEEKTEKKHSLIQLEITLDKEISQLLLVERMKNEFLKARRLSPELFSDELLLKGNKLFQEKAIKLNDNLQNIMKLDVKDNFTTETKVGNDILTSDYYNIMYCCSAMKDLCDALMVQANGDKEKYARLLFDWSSAHILYEKNHNLEHYKSARSTFKIKQAVCGELAIFFNAMCRYAGIPNEYVHVDRDMFGNAVNHSCSRLKINDKYYLVDVAYKTFDAKHRQYDLVSNKEMVTNFKRWNAA